MRTGFEDTLPAQTAALRPADVQHTAEQLVALAAAHGLVLTIEQRPVRPLAMGRYRTVVLVRQAREVGRG